jgi:3-deoxy-manno-octulosonate cytidylyltransferase (CMP-KDO synthetase)
MKIFGFIPVRMASTRFPGKPLKKILNKTMLSHIYERVKPFDKWESLSICTCDNIIQKFCEKNNYPCVITSKKHKGCLDRVFEAATKNKIKIKDNDIVVCVQGDEPMLKHFMIKKLLAPFKNKKTKVTVLAVDIKKKEDYYNVNKMKLIHDQDGKVLVGTRSPVPFYKKFKNKNYAKRIVGVYAFKYKYLKKYFKTKPTPLEIIESCSENRICETFGGFYFAHIKNKIMHAVDVKKDILKVKKLMLLEKK